MRYALISALALCAVVAQAIPQAAPKRKIPCKTPENAASCYWTRGPSRNLRWQPILAAMEDRDETNVGNSQWTTSDRSIGQRAS
jgi:hypothetical protein